jgi:hypothetical protein
MAAHGQSLAHFNLAEVISQDGNDIGPRTAGPDSAGRGRYLRGNQGDRRQKDASQHGTLLPGATHNRRRTKDNFE